MPIEYISNIQTGNDTRPIKDKEAWKLFAGSWLKDKDICMYGDSTLVVAENYADIITASGICHSVTKRAVSGHSLLYNGLPIIREATDLSNFDYVFVCYGINDWSGVAKYLWKNAIRSTITEIVNKGSEPVFVFPWLVYMPNMASGGWINNKGCSMDAYVDAGISVCKELSVKYFNLYTLSGVDKYNYTTKLTPSSNGMYLHEGTDLGKLIATLIVNGNFNSGDCLSGAYNNPSKAILPTDYGYNTEAGTNALLASRVPVEFRKGRITGVSPRTCTFLSMCTGRKVRISGYCGNTLDGGYMTLSAKNLYDNAVTTICRVDATSDFDFTYEPPQNGGFWCIVAESLAETYSVVLDFTIASENGTIRVTKMPGECAIHPTYRSDFTPHDACTIIVNDDGSVEMSGFTGVIEDSHNVGLRYPVCTLPIYPQRVIYGFAIIEDSTPTPAMYRITQNGEVTILFPAIYTGGTLIRFSGANITPSEYFMPNVDV